MRQQFRIVPAIAQLLLARSGRALHNARGIAADGRRKMLRNPGFGRAGHAVQQQRAIRGQRRHGHFYQTARTDIFGADRKAVLQRAAQQIGAHRPGGQFPVLGTRMRILTLEGLQFPGVELLGMLTQKLACGRLFLHDGSPSLCFFRGKGRCFRFLFELHAEGPYFFKFLTFLLEQGRVRQ